MIWLRAIVRKCVQIFLISIFFISLFKSTFKVIKNGIYLIVIALVVAELCKILIYANEITCDVTMWTQGDVKSHEIEYLI